MAAGIPVGKVMDVVSGLRESIDRVGREVGIDVRVDPFVPRWIALAVRDDLDPHQPGGQVDVRSLSARRVDGRDVCCAVILGGGTVGAIADTTVDYLSRGVPVAVVVESSLDAPDLDLTDEQAGLYTLVAVSGRDALDEALAGWLLDATSEPVTMAANFPFCRGEEVERLIQRCALENAGVGAVDLIHGADLPIMSANQLKLLFDLAAAHGRGLSPWRLPEAAVVVATGFGYRALSRSMRRLLPLPDFLVRASMAYAGTVATSKALAAALSASEGDLRLPTAEDLATGLRGLLGALGGRLSPRGKGSADQGDPGSLPAGEEGSASYLTYGEDGSIS